MNRSVVRIGLAAVLVLMLVFCGAAGAAVNPTDEAALRAAIGNSDLPNVTLGGNITLTTGTLEIGRTVTLDLNGHVLSRLSTVETDFSVITVTSGGNLTVTDSTPGAVNYLRGLMKDINGGVITGGNANMGGGVYVDIGGNFTLEKGTIAGNSASYDGGGVFVKGDTSGTSGTFTMNGGTISWNCASPEVGGDRSTIAYGGGVYVYMGGTFTMNGGTISENKASIWGSVTTSAGGGVYNYGTFTMNGGSITGNKAIESLNAYGGGVYNYGTFEMTGGTISNNTSNGAHSYGGGVCNYGTFKMTGGEISWNRADPMDAISEGGGVYNNGTFKVSGTPKIIDNTAHGYPVNVYLYSVYSADKLILDGDLTGDADIRISYVWSKQIATGQQFGVVAGSVGENNALSSAAHFHNDARTLQGTVSGTGAERKLVWTTPPPPPDSASAIPFTSDGGTKKTATVVGDNIIQSVTIDNSIDVNKLSFNPHEYIEDLPLIIDGIDVEIVDDSFKLILGKMEQTDIDNPVPGTPATLSGPVPGTPATLSGKLDANLVKGQPGKLRLAQKTDAGGWKLLPVDNGKIEGDWYTFTANFTSTVNGGYMFVLVYAVPAASSGSSVTTFRGSSTIASDGTIVFDRSTVVTELKVAGASGAKLTPNSNKGENGWYGFDLSVENAPNGGDIFYQVPLDVIDIKGFTEQDVCLYHKENGTWTALPTYLVKKDAQYAYYKSVTKSFSPFYIGFEEGSAQTEAVEVIDPSVEADPIQIDPVTPILPQPTKSPAPIAAVIAGLGAAAVFFRAGRQ